MQLKYVKHKSIELCWGLILTLTFHQISLTVNVKVDYILS